MCTRICCITINEITNKFKLCNEAQDILLTNLARMPNLDKKRIHKKWLNFKKITTWTRKMRMYDERGNEIKYLQGSQQTYENSITIQKPSPYQIQGSYEMLKPP